MMASNLLLQIPPHGGGQALLKAVARLPPQLGADAGGIDGIAPFVAGAVSDPGD